MAGSARTNAMALLRVLNKKWGRMRDCSSAKRATVSAGVRLLARMTKPATNTADNKAPLPALAHQGGESTKPAKTNSPQPYKPASAPKATAIAYWARGCQRANQLLTTQPVINHASVAGKAAPVCKEKDSTQFQAVLDEYMAATATASSTNKTARKTTPIWQASNTSTTPGAG